MTLWDYWAEGFTCPFSMQRIGVIGDGEQLPCLTSLSAYLIVGGKFICGFDRLVQLPALKVFSFGVEHQSSFEAEFLTKSEGAAIWAFCEFRMYAVCKS